MIGPRYMWVCQNCGRMHTDEVEEGKCPCNGGPPMRAPENRAAKSYTIKTLKRESRCS